ncbi:MAG: chemotaxis protein CheD [Deltaproteobacteria bacterium]|nr:chemotaxis protein CheD [Deltaproteobacteria bacterium]
MLRKITINIGEYYASKEASTIYTLLGSCVAVCLYDPINKIGGMNHILLPGRANLKHFDASARYGMNALELLINAIMGLGGDRRKIVAKAFGGGSVLPTIAEENGMGQRIVEFVKKFLNNERIRIVSYDFGDTVIRKVYFHTDTGDVYLKRINPTLYPDVGIREKKWSETLKLEANKGCKIDLF